MLPAVSKVVLEDVLLEWEEEVISRGGEKKKGRKKGKVKKKGREGGTEGRKKKKNRKEKKKKGRINTSTHNQRSPTALAPEATHP